MHRREQPKRPIKQATPSQDSRSEAPEQPEDPEQSFGGKECGMCQDVPESIIYLSCDHIVCLVCAAKLILSAADIQEVDFSEVVCGLCGETTELSKEVQETLIEFLNSGEFEIDEDQEENQEEEDEEQENGPVHDEGEEEQEEEENEEEEEEEDDQEDSRQVTRNSLEQLGHQVNPQRLMTIPREADQEDQQTARANDDTEEEGVKNSVNFNESSQSKLNANSIEKGATKVTSQSKHKAAETKNHGRDVIGDAVKGSKKSGSPMNRQVEPQTVFARPPTSVPQVQQAQTSHKPSPNAMVNQKPGNSTAQTHSDHPVHKSKHVQHEKQVVENHKPTKESNRRQRAEAKTSTQPSRPATEPEPFEDKDASEFALSFYCQKHVNEEYSYYNPDNRRLYCAQCLLTELPDKAELAFIRPLKKCLPEILQNFQDMLNEVEVARSLLENRKRDFEIRRESARAQCFSHYKKFELALDEFAELIDELKAQGLKEFETRNEELFADLEGCEGAFEDKVAYFTAVIDQVTSLRQSSENPEEEIFSFFFANQEKISSALSEETKDSKGRSTKNNAQVFDTFNASLKAEQGKLLRTSLEALRDKIDKALVGLTPTLPSNSLKYSGGFVSGANMVPSQPSQRGEGGLRDSQIELAQPFNQSTSQFVSRNVSHLAQTQAPGISMRPLPTSPSYPSTHFPAQTQSRYISSNFFREELAPSLRKLTGGTDPYKPTGRYASSVDALKYSVTQSSNPSKLKGIPWESENSLLANRLQTIRPSQTLSRQSYNLEKKLELERKLRLFDLKARKDESIHSSVNTVLNFGNKSVVGLGSLSGICKDGRFGGEALGRRERESNNRCNFRNASEMSIK